MSLSFDELKSKYAQVSAQVERFRGRKEAAEKALETLRSSLKEKGIDPEDLDRYITSSTDELNVLMAELTDEILAIETDLQAMAQKTAG